MSESQEGIINFVYRPVFPAIVCMYTQLLALDAHKQEFSVSS